MFVFGKGRQSNQPSLVIMAFRLLLVLLATCSLTALAHSDDDFAEFDDEEGEFDFDMPEEGIAAGSDESDQFDDGDDGEEMTVENDDEDVFEVDVEEFETNKGPALSDKIELSESTVKIKITWQSYVIEILIGGGMALYFLNYMFGRSRNSSVAQSWLDSQMDLLNRNFALVGDTGEGEEPTEGQLIKESDNTFMIWASGRQNCLGMAVQLDLLQRHDLFNTLLGLFKSEMDTVNVVFQLDEEDMDSFVLVVGQKKALLKMQKEYEDLTRYVVSSLLPLGDSDDLSGLYYLSEIRDVSTLFLSDRILTLIGNHSDILESIHITDQYTGFVQENEDSDVVVVKKPQKRLQITFKVWSLDESDRYLKFSLQLLDHLKMVRLNREAKEKAIKNRTRVAQSLDKLQHTQRQEAAKQRREEKKKLEKERMMNETDPEKTRKWEERENRRARKKMQSKMAKSMKVRATA